MSIKGLVLEICSGYKHMYSTSESVNAVVNIGFILAYKLIASTTTIIIIIILYILRFSLFFPAQRFIK